MNILFVCLGNICRSPMAEFIMKQIIKQQHINDVDVKSCGLSDYHQGEDMHHMSKQTLINHQIEVGDFQSQPINEQLINWSDYILLMDDSNLNQIKQRFNNIDLNKVYKLTDYRNEFDYLNVPDPWYTNNFELVYQILFDAIKYFIELKVKG